MGKKDADEMLFWTKNGFEQFIEAIKNKPPSASQSPISEWMARI